jgi:acyl-coenzyme A thioesterase PaaI-like protein
MKRPRPEPMDIVRLRRDGALAWLTSGIPYLGFLGIGFDRRGDELTAVLPFAETNIGNPMIPALHGGVTSAFLEVTAIVGLSWSTLWEEIEAGRVDPASLAPGTLPALPKTINFTVDYLRAGLPREAYARARIMRSGRRFASVQVEAWQDNVARPFALGLVHLIMPPMVEPARS